MDCTNTMYCWTPGTDKVALIPWPDRAGRSAAYQRTAGACFSHQHDASFQERQVIVLADALAMIVRDKCDPKAVHLALMGLEEYASAMAEDMPRP